MISETLQDAFNAQINAETYSAYLYWSMSAALEEMNLPGFANWMRIQAQEEMTHAMKFYHYLIERGGSVQLTAIDGPKTEWVGVKEVFNDTLVHEQHVTSLINGLMDLAIEEKDHAGQIFLQWFISEQVEEEATAQETIARIELAGDSKGGLYMLDKEMAARVFTPSASDD